MTLVQLEYIVSVDTHRHFATAAAHCHVTQPTLSMQIQKLEEELGVKIFDRSKQPVVPTEIGEEIIQQSRKALHELKLVPQLVKDKKGLLQGELRIGIIPTLAPYLLPLFLYRFLDKYPGVRLKIKEMTTDVLTGQLKKGYLDAGLLVTPLNDPSINEHPLFYEEMVAYVARENAAYKKTYVLPKDIELNELWLLEEGHCFRSQILNLCELSKISREQHSFEYEAGSVEALRKMVEMNKGITILPELATYDFTESQAKLIRHFRAPIPVREVSLVTHRDYVKKKLIDLLKKEIITHMPEKIRKNKRTNIVSIEE